MTSHSCSPVQYETDMFFWGGLAADPPPPRGGGDGQGGGELDKGGAGYKTLHFLQSMNKIPLVAAITLSTWLLTIFMVQNTCAHFLKLNDVVLIWLSPPAPGFLQ